MGALWQSHVTWRSKHLSCTPDAVVDQMICGPGASMSKIGKHYSCCCANSYSQYSDFAEAEHNQQLAGKPKFFSLHQEGQEHCLTHLCKLTYPSLILPQPWLWFEGIELLNVWSCSSEWLVPCRSLPRISTKQAPTTGTSNGKSLDLKWVIARLLQSCTLRRLHQFAWYASRATDKQITAACQFTARSGGIPNARNIC